MVTVPRGAFRKPRAGRHDLVSPLPCPFDYGEIVDEPAADGDAADAIVFGARGAREGDWPVVGVVRFVDDGVADDKWIVGRPPNLVERALLAVFFRAYAALKLLVRGGGDSRYVGIDVFGAPRRPGA